MANSWAPATWYNLKKDTSLTLKSSGRFNGLLDSSYSKYRYLFWVSSRHDIAVTEIAWTRVLARHVVRAGMMGARWMWVLARLAIHSSLALVLFIFLFFSSLLWLLYNTLRYFSEKGKEVAVLFSRAALMWTLGLRPYVDQMHVLKSKQKKCVQ